MIQVLPLLGVQSYLEGDPARKKRYMGSQVWNGNTAASASGTYDCGAGAAAAGGPVVPGN